VAVDLGTAFGRIVVDGRGANAGVGVATRGLLGLNRTAALVGAGVAVAVGGAFAHVVKTAATFEQAMANLNAVSGATAAQLGRLREQALSLGASTAFSASEVAAAQLELAKAGIAVEDVLGGGVQGSLALAAAGDLELADAATIAANAMNLFALEGRDVGKIADALAVAANATTADVADFGMALTQGGAAAKAAGLSFTDTLTILEALAQAGVKNSDAGTSMKAALLQLLNPTAKQAALQKDLGLRLFDNNGRLRDAAGLSDELRQATGKMNQSERAKALAILAGTDGLRTMLALYDAGPAKLRGMERGLDRTGYAAEVAGKRQDSLGQDLEQLQGAIETIEIRLGSLLIPVLRDGAVALTDLLAAAGDSEGLERFGENRADGLREFGSIVTDVSSAAWPLLVQGATIAGDALTLLGTIAGAAGPSVETLGVALGTTAAVVLGVVGPVLQVANALAQVPGVATAAATALLALGVAFAALKVGGLAAGIAGTVSSFLSLAAGVRSFGAASALAGASAPRLAAALAAFGGGAGLAAAGVGVLVAGVALLASGFFSGQSPAEALAESIRNVDAAARNASSAVRGLRDATDALEDANLTAKEAALRVKEAEAELARVRADPAASPNAIARAELTLQRARLDGSRATRDRSAAEGEAARKALDGAVALAELATEQGRATDKARQAHGVSSRLAEGFGLSRDEAGRLASELGKLTSGSVTTAARMGALQQAAKRAAAGIEGTGPAAQRAKRQLEAIAGATPGQLVQFVRDINAGTARGESRAAAAKAAINRLLSQAGSGVTVDMSSLAASIRAGGQSAIAAAEAVAAAVRRSLSKANPNARSSPSANDLLRAGLKDQRTIMENGLRATENATRVGVNGIIAAERKLADELEALDRRFARVDAARERRRLQAATSRGTGDERAQARRDLADFNRQAARDRQRSAVESAQAAAQAVIDGFSTVESQLSAIGQAAGTAIEAGLRRSLDAIASSPEAQRVAAIGSEVDALRAARTARDQARQRRELEGTLGTADALVARRQESLGRARTDAERQAATTLLNQALAEQAAARQALADLDEDARIATLEAERAGLEAQLQARRDAETQAAADERAATERALSDLGERLRARTITYKQFGRELAGILGGPRLKAELEESGRELGLSFSRGLDRAIGGAEDAAERMARAIAKYLKLRSPAEAGPLRHDFTRSGLTIGTDLAAGIHDSRRAVAAEARRMASAAALADARGRGGDRGAPPAAWAGTVGGDTWQITTHPNESALELAARLSWERRYGRPGGR
jgi:TP901 family phage tail tape measure protein